MDEPIKPMADQASEHYQKGREAEDRGNNEKAYKEFQEAVILDPDSKVYQDALNRVDRFHKSKLAEGRLGEWLGDYLQGEVDASILPVLLLLDCIFQWDISEHQKAYLNAVILSLIVKGSLSTKEEQQIKNAFKDGIDAVHHSSGHERDNAIETMSDRITEIIDRKKRG